ncbi:hypothetical protein BSU04_06625 [Caballeronia sordidicola]|uniref:Uncharacterized protein n=1 Tax=Caballeronia sordidicola TaxID=196367 RepID=A0A226X7P0_CABSO|nr:hypothetical protein BSU04_06625 [Caballeronia sordidicola]
MTDVFLRKIPRRLKRKTIGPKLFKTSDQAYDAALLCLY